MIRCLLLALGLIALSACGTRVETWPDGSPKAEGKVVRGLQTGPWTYYRRDGSTEATGEWMMDKQVGLWTWFQVDGSVRQQGAYAEGMRHGWWIYRHADGGIKATGAYGADRQDGLWHYADESGAVTATGTFTRGARDGLWVFYRPDGQVRELGCYVDGRRAGPWLATGDQGVQVEAHGAPAGWQVLVPAERTAWPRQWVLDGPFGRRMAVAVGRGVQPELAVDRVGEDATFVAFREEGVRVAGTLGAGTSTAGWMSIAADGVATAIALGPDGPSEGGEIEPNASAAPDAGGLDDVGGDLAPDMGQVAAEVDAARDALVEMVAEIQTGAASLLDAVERGKMVALEDAPASDPAPAADLDLSPTVAPPLAMTAEDQKQLARAERVYANGGEFSGKQYGADKNASRIREDLEGKPLPQTRFLDGQGGVVDVAEMTGRNVVLVVMRGFAGSVCPYCSGQTRALITRAKDFAAQDADILVVYPGPASAVPGFIEAVTGASDGELPLTLLLDLDLGFVRATAIEGDLSAPTTFIIDRQGVVRFCYQGRDLADRPTVPDMLRQLAQLEAGDG